MTTTARFLRALILLSAFGIPGPATAVDRVTIPADPESAALGITEYLVTRDGKLLDITVKMAKGSPVSMQAEFDTPEGIVLTLDRGHGAIRITWDPAQQNSSVTDLSTGRSVRRAYEKGKGFKTVGGQDKLIQRRYPDISFAFHVFDQMLVHLGLYKFFSPLQPQPQPQPQASPLEPLFLRCPPACEGPWVTGTAAATSRSRCCEIARDNVNHNCTNGICFGCCQLLACDAFCGLQDYACVCTMNGKSCSDPLFDCNDDTWPPECI